MRLLDENGDTVSLWQFYGDLIVLELTTMWIYPMQYDWATPLVDEYADDGLVHVVVLVENALSEPPDQDDLLVWAEGIGISGPVLLIDRSMVVVADDLAQSSGEPAQSAIETHL